MNIRSINSTNSQFKQVGFKGAIFAKNFQHHFDGKLLSDGLISVGTSWHCSNFKLMEHAYFENGSKGENDLLKWLKNKEIEFIHFPNLETKNGNIMGKIFQVMRREFDNIRTNKDLQALKQQIALFVEPNKTDGVIAYKYTHMRVGGEPIFNTLSIN